MTIRIPAVEIKRAAAAVAKLTVEHLEGQQRSRPIARARQRAMYVIRELRPDLSSTYIGIIFGDRDHTTVLHALKVVPARMAADPDEAEAVRAIFKEVAARQANKAA